MVWLLGITAVSCGSTHVGNPADVFVEAGNDCGQGTPECPVATLAAGLALRDADDPLRLIVRPGLYREALRIERDVTILAADADEPPRIVSGRPIAIEVVAGQAEFVGLVLVADPSVVEPSFGVVGRGAATVTLRDLDVSGFGASGLYVEAARVSVTGGAFHDNGASGVTVGHGDARVTLDGVDIRSNAGRGLSVEGGTIRVSGGRITGTRPAAGAGGYGDGIEILPGVGAEVTIDGVAIENNARGGLVSFDPVGALTVAGSRVRHNAGPGIWLEGESADSDGAGAHDLTGNVVEGNRLAGVGLVGGFVATLERNEVRGTLTYTIGDGHFGGDGIVVLDLARVEGASNRVERNERAGLIGSTATGRLVDIYAALNEYGIVLQLPPESDPLVVAQPRLEANRRGDDILTPRPEEAFAVEGLPTLEAP